MIPTFETTIANALIDAGINEKISVQEAKAFLALLAAATDGWTLVPKLATADMIKAGSTWSGLPAQTWTDMIDAAPASPAPLPAAVKEAQRHVVSLRQCAIFAADVGDNIAKAMTEAADYLSSLQSPTFVLNWTDLEENALQAAADANARQPGYINATETRFVKAAISSIRSALSYPVGGTEDEVEDVVCHEADGCPTEMAVLKRFWREHHAQTATVTDDQIIDIAVCHSNYKETAQARDGSGIIEYEVMSHSRIIKFARELLSLPTPASDIAALREEIARIAGDFVPDRDADAPLALQEMRDALMELAHHAAKGER